MRTGVLGFLLLLQCGPKPADDGDSGASETTSARTTTDASTTTTDPAVTTTGSSTQDEPPPDDPESTTAPPPATTSGACEGPDLGNIWDCECDTILGEWIPFNQACGVDDTVPVEWSEWLCENYAGADLETGTTSPSSTGGDTTSDDTSDTTGDSPLGCKCTCTLGVGCCDTSLP